MKQLEPIDELQELAHLVGATDVDANALVSVALYVLPLAWLRTAGYAR